MKITTVRFRRLQSHDRGYGHDAVEAEAQVDEGESAEDALAALKLWALEQLGRVRETDRLVDQLQTLRERVVDQQRTRDCLKREVDQYRKVIKESDRLYQLAKAAGMTDEAESLFAASDVPF